MNIKLNGENNQTDSATLDDLCRALGYEPDAKIATAVNGDFVAAAVRPDTRLADGDEVEIVAPRQGG